MTAPARASAAASEAKPFGFVERAMGERQRAVAGMRGAGATLLRIAVSEPDYHAAGGAAWYEWLLATLGNAFDLLPCVTPTAWARDDAAFVDTRLSRHGAHFRSLALREALWLETGGSARCRDQVAQVRHFRAALQAPVERLYWRGWQDAPRQSGSAPAERGAPGLTDTQARPELLCRRLQAGSPDAPAIRRGLAAPLCRPALGGAASPSVVLGGAGFIGCNLADSLLGEGQEVVVFDNLGRPGVERNLAWLQARHGTRLHPILADIRDRPALAEAVAGARAVFHLAAQVAVTSSLLDPWHDFSVNAEGTLSVLEAVRARAPAAPVLFASTNKVYGTLADLAVCDVAGSMLPRDKRLRAFGVDEARPLDFCTPYGCSKGVADQYVLDYARSFRLRSAVLRMSCIYGPRQFGTEDQGWVAHFLIRALRGEPITIFGDGKQVRDVLHVRDAVRAYRAVLGNIDRLQGRAFNLGGGPANAVSLHAVLEEIAVLLGRPAEIRYDPMRAGDQPYFVADTRRLCDEVGWRAEIGWRDGLRDLADWLCADLDLPVPGPVVRPELRRRLG